MSIEVTADELTSALNRAILELDEAVRKLESDASINTLSFTLYRAGSVASLIELSSTRLPQMLLAAALQVLRTSVECAEMRALDAVKGTFHLVVENGEPGLKVR